MEAVWYRNAIPVHGYRNKNNNSKKMQHAVFHAVPDCDHTKIACSHMHLQRQQVAVRSCDSTPELESSGRPPRQPWPTGVLWNKQTIKSKCQCCRLNIDVVLKHWCVRHLEHCSNVCSHVHLHTGRKCQRMVAGKRREQTATVFVWTPKEAWLCLDIDIWGCFEMFDPGNHVCVGSEVTDYWLLLNQLCGHTPLNPFAFYIM